MQKKLNSLQFMLIISLLIFPCIMIMTAQSVFAYQTEEKGGLEIIPQSSQSIAIQNMFPGQSHISEFILKNTRDTPIEVSFEQNKVSQNGKADLFNQLMLTLHYDGQEVYQGKIKDLKALELGIIPENGEKEIQIIQHLPGPETGDEFEKTALETQFVFSAKGDVIRLPKTGGSSSVIFWGIGGIMTLTGLSLIKKK